jgi:hypothetical protein
MSEDSASRELGEIVFHFDVARGSIPLSHFIEAARSAEDIIGNFNESLFDKKLEYELYVRTPEAGSLIAILSFIVIGGGKVVLDFIESDIGKATVKGLFQKEPAQFVEEFFSRIRERFILQKPLTSIADNQIEIIPPAKDEAFENERTRRIEAEAVVVMLLKFLELDTDKLRRIGITPEKFRAAYQGRNRFFKACIDNDEVKGIAFERAPNFTVVRSDFPRQITKLPDQRAQEPERVSDLAFETVDIVVNSPNWKRDGRKWQAESTAHQDISFSVDDEAFWYRVERRDRDLQPTIRDNMRVQWAYPIGTGKPAHVKVLRVLSYNGRELAKPMTDQDMQAHQARLHFIEPDAPDLFDEQRGKQKNNNKNNEGNA